MSIPAVVFALQHAAVIAVFFVVALSAGGAAVRKLRFAGDAEAIAFRGALGIGILGTAGALLALCGWFSQRMVVGLAALAVFAGATTLPDSARRILRIAKTALRQPAMLIALLLLAATAVHALWPPHVFDETMYHLPFAKAFVASHRLPFLPETRFPVFPQLCEMLFAEIMAVSDDIGARLVSTVFAALTILGFVAAGKRFSSSRAGMLAACVWIGMPIIYWGAGWAYVDAATAAFVILAFLAWEIWRRTDESTWLPIAGALCGFAVATKMLAAYPAACLFVFVLVDSIRRRRFRAVAIFTFASLLSGGLWYARSFVETGDPLFPFGPTTSAQSPFRRRQWQPGSASYGTAPETGTAANLVVRLPKILRSGRLARVARMFFPAPPFTEMPSFTPWIALAALVAAFDARGRPPTLRLILAAIVSALPANLYEPRYLIPAASLAVAAFATSERAARISRGRWLALLAIVAMSLSITQAASDIISGGALPVTPAARKQYLSGSLRAYRAIAWLNSRYGSNYTAFGLRTEDLRYFAEGRLLGGWAGLTPFEEVASAKSGDELARVLDEFGAGWLVFDPLTSRPLPRDESFRRHFTLTFRANGVELYRIEAR